MAMDQAETFEWLRQRSNRLDEVEKQLARVTAEWDEAVGLLHECPEDDSCNITAYHFRVNKFLSRRDKPQAVQEEHVIDPEVAIPLLANAASGELDRILDEAEARIAAKQTAPSPSPIDVDALLIDGKSPWEFCCDWYSVAEIASGLARGTSASLMLEPHEKIPTNIRSAQFAEWLTHQYRLAMNKGMDLAHRALLAEVREKREELDPSTVIPLREQLAELSQICDDQKEELAADQSREKRLSEPCCSLAASGRGDCLHFVGIPEVLNQDTTDVYGKPLGWCWWCWKSQQLAASQECEKRLRRMLARLNEESRSLALSVCNDRCVHGKDDPISCPLNNSIYSEIDAILVKE